MNAYFSLFLNHTACYLFPTVFSSVPMAMISPNSQYISPKSSASSFPLLDTCHGLTYDTILLMVAAFIEKSRKISSQKYFYLKKVFLFISIIAFLEHRMVPARFGQRVQWWSYLPQACSPNFNTWNPHGVENRLPLMFSSDLHLVAVACEYIHTNKYESMERPKAYLIIVNCLILHEWMDRSVYASVMLKKTSVYLWFSNCLNLVIVWK